MTKLDKLYSTIKNLEELGIELPADVLKQTAELEESLIKKEILPVVRQQIEPVLCNIHRDLTFVVDYVPGIPVRVRISRKAGIYDNNDFIELTPDPEVEHSSRNGGKQGKHAPASGLRVIRKDGSFIQEKYAGHTLVTAIKEAGPRRVRELNIICCKVLLVSTTKDKKYGHTQEEVEPGLYVIKHSNNNMKKDFLDTISKAFNLGWTVEVLR